MKITNDQEGRKEVVRRLQEMYRDMGCPVTFEYIDESDLICVHWKDEHDPLVIINVSMDSHSACIRDIARASKEWT